MRSNAELSENWIALKFLPVEKSFDWKCSWGLVDMCIDNTKPRNESVIIYQFSPFKSSQSEWSLFTYRKSLSNNFVQSKQKKNLYQKVATKSSIPKEKWLSIEMGKYPKNSANDWKFVTIGKKCEKYFSKSIDRVLTSSSTFFLFHFYFLIEILHRLDLIECRFYHCVLLFHTFSSHHIAFSCTKVHRVITILVTKKPNHWLQRKKRAFLMGNLLCYTWKLVIDTDQLPECLLLLLSR